MNKASGGDGIPVELFPIIKDDAVKEPASYSMTSPITELGNQHECEKNLDFKVSKNGLKSRFFFYLLDL